MHWASLRPSLTATSIAAGVRRPLAAALKQPGTVVAGGKPVIATPAPGLVLLVAGHTAALPVLFGVALQ